VALSRREYLTPRSRFPPSRPVYGRVFETEAGNFLLVGSHLGPDDPIHTVGWARNAYWAVRIWGFDGYEFRNDCDPDAAASAAPSLAELGWPDPLTYALTLQRAKECSREPVMVTNRYRLTDGGFESHEIGTAERVKLHFGNPNPRSKDMAVAVEFGLGGRRWERHLAEIRAINRLNAREDT
jgi:hypothetical protein